ncbi:MAG: hypothetical protein ABW095_07145, partial [Candidatus Thiodiazotropha sp.]
MSQMPDRDDPRTSLEQAGIGRLDPAQRSFLQQQSERYRFTYQELRQLCDMAVDLSMWGEGRLESAWP